MIRSINTIIKSFLLIILSVFLSSCIKEKPINPDPQSIEFDCDNGFHELTMDAKTDWIVKTTPEWLTPLQSEGSTSTTLIVFVEANFEESVRIGELIVEFSDGSQQLYNITQQSRLSENINGQTIIKQTDLKLTYGVGYPTNVLISNKVDKYSVSANSPINFGKLIKELANIGESDAIYGQDQYSSRYESATGSSTTAISNQLSVNAGIEVGISGFQLSIEGGFSKKTSSNQKSMYAIEEIQHIIGSRYMRSGMLQYLSEKGANIFQSTFNSYCKILKTNPNDVATLRNIVNKYGTHIVTYGSLGCEMKLSMEMVVSEGMSEQDIHAALDLSCKAVGANADFQMSNKEKSIASNTTISLVTYGGNNEYAPTLGMDFDTFRKTVKSKEKLDRWSEGATTNDPSKVSLHLIDMQTMPIYELMPTEESRNALRNYIVGDYQKEILMGADKNYKGPDLYKITNYPVSSEFGASAKVKIPEIDLEIVAQHTIHPWISEKEYTTVIYSGTIGKVNYNKGFFVGSETRKPGKVSKNNNGKFEIIEEFDALSVGAITELYADVTGDITIYPKGLSSFYRTIECEVTSPDLKLQVGDLIIDEDCTLKGRFMNDIYIKDRTNITLNGLYLDGTIFCYGHATINLATNSINDIYVSGGYNDDKLKPGICPPRHYKTLTITGNGKLTITSSEGSAIGNGVRPYESEFLGEEWGNLRILGGHIVAVTRKEYCPAIGTVFIDRYGDPRSSRCEEIFIGKDVTKIEVRKGYNALQAIGIGSSRSECKKITIEDPSKIVER